MHEHESTFLPLSASSNRAVKLSRCFLVASSSLVRFRILLLTCCKSCLARISLSSLLALVTSTSDFAAFKPASAS